MTPRARRFLVPVALLAGACAPESEAPRPAPAFELRAVVAPALSALAPELEPPPAAVAPLAEAELEELLGPLRGGDADLRALAVEDAVRHGARAVPGLARALLDPDETDAARLGSAHALGALATGAALEALLACAAGDGPAWLRAQCFHQIGLTGRDEGVPRLLLRLKYEKDHEAVYWLADALARLGSLAGLEALLTLWATSEREDLREYAAFRLNELAAEHGVASAEELRARWSEGELTPVREPSPALRHAAWTWIQRLGNYDLRSVDDARFVLVRLEPWVVPLLAATLHEENAHVRLHAAQCLARRGRRAREAHAELVAALADERIGPAAAEALGELGDPRGAGPLEAVLGASPDLELRVAAARALGALSQASSRDALRGAFDPTRPDDLRLAAAEALLTLEPSVEALAFLVACLEDPRADAGAAEVALGDWLERRAAGSAAHADALARWRGLDLEPGRIPDVSQQAERRSARAELCRALAP